MKKELIIAAAAFTLTAAPVFAQSHDNGFFRHNENQNSQGQNQDNNQNKHIDDEITSIPTVSPVQSGTTVTPSPCAGDNDGDHDDNHGQIVSCFAHQHLGGEEVSEIARDKNDQINDNDQDDNTPSITPSTTPTVSLSPTPSATPSTSPTPSVSVTPTPSTSVSPSPITGPMSEVNEGESPLGNLGRLLSRFFFFITHIF